MIATRYSITKVDRKVKKVIKSVDVEEATELFNEQVKVLKAHIFVKKNTKYSLQLAKRKP